MVYPLLLCAGAAALYFYVREKLRAYTLKAVFLKALVSVLFVSVAVYGAAASSARGAASPLTPFVILGLLCGLLGDVWLDLKYVYPADSAVFTYAGFLSFGVGHVLFIAGMLLGCCPAGKPLYAVLPVLLAVLLSIGNSLMEKPMKLSYGKMKPTVILYGALLFSTVLLSGSLALYFRWQFLSLNLFFAGAVLFALSDLILSGTYFGTGEKKNSAIVLNYLTYYPAQFLIASSLLFLP